MDLSVITVTWNSKDLIGEQIRSVFSGCKNISFEEIVVDNASTDGTAAYVREQYPTVQVIANTENKGFGHANNQGVAVSSGEFLLFLNPDMRVEPGSLDTIIAWMRQRPQVGIASCKLMHQDGTLNRNALPRRFPQLRDQLIIFLKLPHLFPSILDRYLMKDFDAKKEQEVDSVRGSFMIVRRTLVEKLGWAFDPRYYIWFEDVDLCREAKRHGFKVMYAPVITCVDYVGRSFQKRSLWWKQWQFFRSATRYFLKWGFKK